MNGFIVQYEDKEDGEEDYDPNAEEEEDDEDLITDGDTKMEGHCNIMKKAHSSGNSARYFNIPDHQTNDDEDNEDDKKHGEMGIVMTG